MTSLDRIIAAATAKHFDLKAIADELDPALCGTAIIRWYGKGEHIDQCKLLLDHEGDHVYGNDNPSD